MATGTAESPLARFSRANFLSAPFFHRKCLICPKHASYIPRFPSLDMRGLHAPSAAQNQNKIPFPTIPGRGWGRGGTVDARGRRRHFVASTSSSGHSLRHPPSKTSTSPSIPPLMSPNSSLSTCSSRRPFRRRIFAGRPTGRVCSGASTSARGTKLLVTKTRGGVENASCTFSRERERAQA